MDWISSLFFQYWNEFNLELNNIWHVTNGGKLLQNRMITHRLNGFIIGNTGWLGLRLDC